MSRTLEEARPLLGVEDESNPLVVGNRPSWTKRTISIIATACLGVGLCLAIALPLALSSSQTTNQPSVMLKNGAVLAPASSVEGTGVDVPHQSDTVKKTNKFVLFNAAPPPAQNQEDSSVIKQEE